MPAILVRILQEPEPIGSGGEWELKERMEEILRNYVKWWKKDMNNNPYCWNLKFDFLLPQTIY